MANEYSSVDCTEEFGTATESYSIDGHFEAQVVLNVEGADKDDLISDLLTNQRPWPNTGFTVKPKAHRCSTRQFFSEDAPVSGQQNFPAATGYQVTVYYTTNPDVQLISETLQPEFEFVLLDHRYFRWSSGAPLVEGEAPGLLQPGVTLIRQYYKSAALPTLFLSAGGKVHNASFISSYLGITFGSETLLYAPDPAVQSLTMGGASGFDFALKFHYRPQGWNTFFRASTNAWESIYNSAGTQVKPYTPADLSSLL